MISPSTSTVSRSRPTPSETEREADESAVLRVVQRVYRSCGRGFALGLALRGGLHAVSTSVQVLRGQTPRQSKTEQAWDSLRYAAALAAFASTYVSVDEGIRCSVGTARCFSIQKGGSIF